MNDLADTVAARLDVVKKEQEENENRRVRAYHLYELNEFLGRGTDALNQNFLYRARSIADYMDVVGVPDGIISAANRFFSLFRNKHFYVMDSKDILLLGMLIQATLGDKILYDPESFSFYYPGTLSRSEKYKRKMQEYMSLSWWKRGFTTTPTLIYPKWISSNKLPK